jgi:hypothetical protein
LILVRFELAAWQQTTQRSWAGNGFVSCLERKIGKRDNFKDGDEVELHLVRQAGHASPPRW